MASACATRSCSTSLPAEKIVHPALLDQAESQPSIQTLRRIVRLDVQRQFTIRRARFVHEFGEERRADSASALRVDQRDVHQAHFALRSIDVYTSNRTID